MSWEVKNEFIEKDLFVKSMKKKIVGKGLVLQLSFLIIPSRCSMKLSLLSILTPSSFSQALFSIFIFPIIRFMQLCLLVIR